ncbi:DUF2141 domain-containing protein [Maribacter sp.]|nr:DUF2141 domain-containing protein [Maribacter sp.]
MLRLLPFFILLSFYGFSQNTLTVEVSGVSSSEGNISIGVYTDAEGFLKTDKIYKGLFIKSTKGITKAVFKNLPSDTYAIALFHDENANEELDTNFFGIPKEPLGFSIGRLKTFGPPSFEECSFLLESDMKINIPLSD